MYLIFDTETTGANKARDRTVQLAWMLTDEDGIELEKNCFIIKPSGFSIPSGAAAIHGISTERAYSDGEELEYVLSEFVSAVDDASVLVAHNIDFDIAILRNDFSELGFDDPFSKKDRICTMRASTAWCRIPHFNGRAGFKWPKLEELHYRLFGEYIDGAHDALVDVEATKRCFFELIELGVIERARLEVSQRHVKNDREEREESIIDFEVSLPLVIPEAKVDESIQNSRKLVEAWKSEQQSKIWESRRAKLRPILSAKIALGEALYSSKSSGLEEAKALAIPNGLKKVLLLIESTSGFYDLIGILETELSKGNRYSADFLAYLLLEGEQASYVDASILAECLVIEEYIARSRFPDNEQRKDLASFHNQRRKEVAVIISDEFWFDDLWICLLRSWHGGGGALTLELLKTRSFQALSAHPFAHLAFMFSDSNYILEDDDGGAQFRIDILFELLNSRNDFSLIIIVMLLIDGPLAEAGKSHFVQKLIQFARAKFCRHLTVSESGWISGGSELSGFLLNLCEEIASHSKAYAIFLRMQVELGVMYHDNVEAYLGDNSTQIRSDFQYLVKVGVFEDVKRAWSSFYRNHEKLSEVYRRIKLNDVVVGDLRNISVADALEAALFDVYSSFEYCGYGECHYSLSTIFKSHVFLNLHPISLYFDMGRKGKLSCPIPKWHWVIADLILQKELHLRTARA